jgi:glycine cleavage system H protein
MATLAKYTLPDDLYYDRDSHLWLRRDTDTIILGLDMLGQASMGDLAYISFEATGKQVRRGEALGSMEAAKMVAPILSPISGEIIKRNEDLTRTPQLVHESPYDQGWLFVIRPTKWDEESQDLLSGAEAIQSFLGQELRRYQEQGWID